MNTASYILPSAIENTGSEGDSAARMRALRERSASRCDGKTSHSDGASQCDDREEKKRGEKEKIQNRGEKDDAATPPALARDSRNLIFVNDEDYNGLITDLGEEELQRCISYLSEYCATHNKRYHDWPTMIRKASREQWGMKPSGGLTISGDFQPSVDRIQKNNDWLDSFLAEQKKQEGKKRFDDLPDVIVLH